MTNFRHMEEVGFCEDVQFGLIKDNFDFQRDHVL